MRSSNYRTRERGEEPSLEGPSGEEPTEGAAAEETIAEETIAEETTAEAPSDEAANGDNPPEVPTGVAIIDLGDGCGRRKRWGDV